jgi:hypothetical protein
MNHNEEYKGRTIQVTVSQRGTGRRATYTWDYVIGPEMIYRQNGDRPLESEEIMLQEAISNAKWEIDHLPPLAEKSRGT